MERVFNFLKNEVKLNKEDIIVAGVSAGPDSMALLDILIELRKKINFKIIVAHVNHNVRKESFEEAIFLEKYCQDNEVVFEKMVIEKYGDDNFHNEARNIRYDFYHNLIKKYNANYLMTGHHGDDLIETVLMRIVRGSTLRGYSGFNNIIDMGEYKLVRPLVFVTKKDLEEYDKEKNIPYRIDKSNFKDKYTRNRYRKNVLPFLKVEDKNVHEKFYKYSKSLIECDNFINNIVNNIFNDVYKDGIIDINLFWKLDIVLQKRIIDRILSLIYQDDLIEIDDKHIELIMKTIYSDKASVQYNLPNDYLVIKEYNKIYFKKVVNEINAYDIELSDEVFLPNGMVIKKVEKIDENGNDILRLNSNDITLPLRVRTRKNGDKMAVMNFKHSKKVSDIFIDSKIPISKRDSWPIVVDSQDKIIWIPNVKKSKYNRLKTENCDIIYKCC